MQSQIHVMSYPTFISTLPVETMNYSIDPTYIHDSSVSQKTEFIKNYQRLFVEISNKSGHQNKKVAKAKIVKTMLYYCKKTSSNLINLIFILFRL